MKKIFLSFVLLGVITTSFAQDKKDVEMKKHELKINIGYLMGGIPEISYEYILDEESGLGVDLLFSVVGDSDLKFALTPHYRFYFGNDVSSGFFAEGFGMLNTIENYCNDIYYNDFDEDIGYCGTNMGGTTNETDFALGVSIGAKFKTNSNFIFEIYGGVGRNLFNTNSQEFVPRGGITFGKRF